MSSFMIISGETEEIFNFTPSFEELQILEEMGTHTNSSPSGRRKAKGSWYVAVRDYLTWCRGLN